jgi:uncharacterized protein (TIGR03083 family)
MQPPVALRDRLVQSANDRVRAVTAQEALQAETERFENLLTTLDETDLDAVTHNGLSVRDLVAHVEAIDRAFVAEATTPRFRLIGAAEVEAITAETLPQHAGESFGETVTRFRRTRSELVALGDRVPADQRLAGYRRDDSLVIRAFETWTHQEDIERALGRDRTVPAPAVMRAMTELAMHSLPLAMAVRGTAHAGRTARIVLTGAGGGEWTIACGPGQPGPVADVVIRTSAVDWCRRFADRLAADEVPLDVDGDVDLARELVSAANAFAGL